MRPHEAGPSGFDPAPSHSGEKGREDCALCHGTSRDAAGHPCAYCLKKPASGAPEDDLAARLDEAAEELGPQIFPYSLLREAAEMARASNPESLGSTGTGDLGSSGEGAQ